MQAFRRRDIVAAIVIAIVAGLLTTAPALDLLRGLTIDALTTLRWRALGARHDPASSPTVVIALDEESLRVPPLAGSPVITWTREIGRVVTMVVDGGARVIGFDVVFPTSIEQSEIAFGDETLGARMRGFDRDFLRALAVPAAAGKIVLGASQSDAQPIGPAAGQRVAVGGQRNIRTLNVYTDQDDVVRRVPLMVTAGGEPVPAMALELAARALGAAPSVAADRSVTLAGYAIPAIAPGAMTLNFDGGTDDIPTYSFADLRACAQKGDTEFFRRNFAGKVVLLGSDLAFQDRKLTAKRFATTPAAAAAERCALPAPRAPTSAGTTTGGVYVQATAVNNLLRREAVTELGRVPSALVAAAFAALVALAVLAVTPTVAALAFVGLAAAWTAAATVVFERALALPLFQPLFAGLVALVVTTGFRLIVADKDKRLLRRSFALYLAPAVIEKMLAANKLPELGGETRIVTILFADLAGFSSFSETMRPAEIVALMNRYLSVMSDTIEEHGGFVDKYVGDAIVAVFGAPVHAANHAADAVRAALRCHARLAELNAAAPAPLETPLAHRIGLNSGETLVGNIGSRRRFNYTAIGDAVNLASRLEGANKHFGTAILASEATMTLAGTAFRWRELDAIRVKGRKTPVRVYEPLGEAGQTTPEQTASAEAYACGLAAWRRRDFAAAAESFARAAAVDPPSAILLARAKTLARDPPGADWEPITTLDDK
ncbi:MAG TPA: adenylate/guanylate cyclase domain-containing protein [Xanthobacteraceae bacterium]|nr:adenylate/guanylate cyclase domain-containing protein [Xanthobacteraceae bacterium]